MAKKYTRKQLKRPDEFLSLSMKIWQYTRENAPYVLLSLGVATVIIGIIWGWTYFSDSRAAKYTAMISRAMDIYNQPVISGENKLPPTDDDGIPRFKTRAEKLNAVEQELNKAVEAGGSMGANAQGIRAGVRYDAGKYKEAIADYQRYLEKVDVEKLRHHALEAMGYCYEALKEYDKALEQFRKLPQDGENRYQVQFHEARLLAKKGQSKEAVKLFKEIIGKAHSESLQDKASDQLAILESK